MMCVQAVLVRAAILALAVVAVAGDATAQLPPVPPAMAQLDFLVGDWEGSGWMEYEPGQRGEFHGTERVERRMGGRLVVVEGNFLAHMGPGLGDVPVHQALGILSYDAATDGFVFRTFTPRIGSGMGTQRAEVDGRRMIWSYEDPSFGTVRYTITVMPDGEWRETGEVSRDDGVNWYEFFEMRLRRK